MPEFRKFRRAYVTSGPVPIVAIRESGRVFGLNLKAYEALGQPKAVEYLYDPNERIIGLRGAERDVPDAYSIRNHNGKRFEVASKAFLNHYDIPVSEVGGRRYKAEMTDGVLTIDLKQDPQP